MIQKVFFKPLLIANTYPEIFSRFSYLFNEAVYKFSNIRGAKSEIYALSDNIQQDSFRGSADIWHHQTKCICDGALVPVICGSLI